MRRPESSRRRKFFEKWPPINQSCPNASQVEQGVARKAQQEPEGEMEETETAAAAEAVGFGYFDDRGWR